MMVKESYGITAVEEALLRFTGECPYCHERVTVKEGERLGGELGLFELWGGENEEQNEEQEKDKEHWCDKRMVCYLPSPVKIQLMESEIHFDSFSQTVFIYLDRPTTRPATILEFNCYGRMVFVDFTFWGKTLINMAKQVSRIRDDAYMSGGAGRPYLNIPFVHVVGRRVLISQSGGLDI